MKIMQFTFVHIKMLFPYALSLGIPLNKIMQLVTFSFIQQHIYKNVLNEIIINSSVEFSFFS